MGVKRHRMNASATGSSPVITPPASGGMAWESTIYRPIPKATETAVFRMMVLNSYRAKAVPHSTMIRLDPRPVASPATTIANAPSGPPAGTRNDAYVPTQVSPAASPSACFDT